MKWKLLLSLIYSIVNIAISYFNYTKRDYEYSSRTGFLIRRNLSELDAIKEGCSSGLGKYEAFFQPYNQRNQYFTISINAGYFLYFLILIGWDIERNNLSKQIQSRRWRRRAVRSQSRTSTNQTVHQLHVRSVDILHLVDRLHSSVHQNHISKLFSQSHSDLLLRCRLLGKFSCYSLFY